MQREQEQKRNFLTISEVSNYLQIKQKTIYAKVEAGDIPCYRIGGLIRFRLEEIDKWLESCRSCNKPEEQSAIKKNRKKSSKRSNNHVDKIARNVIDEETKAYYSIDNGKSDRIEGPREETSNGSI